MADRLEGIACIIFGIIGLAMAIYEVSNFNQAVIIADLNAIAHGLFALAFVSFSVYMFVLAGLFLEIEPEKAVEN